MRLGLEKLSASDMSKAKVIITTARESYDYALENRLSVSGLLTSEITISGGNEYNNPFEDIPVAQKVLKGVNYAKVAANMAGGKAGGQLALLSKNQTIMFYKGSAKPSFNLELCFITQNSNKPITEQVQALMRTVYPTQFGKGGELLAAPLGYSPEVNRAYGTVVIKVGEWFRAMDMVFTNVSFTFSQAATRSGAPLYAVGQITFEPYRNISYEELMQYFLV